MKLNSIILGFAGNVLASTMLAATNTVGETTTNYRLGTIVPYLDDFWGGGEFMYGQAVTAVGQIPRWGLVMLNSRIATISSADGSATQRVLPTFEPVQSTFTYRNQPVGIATRNFANLELGWIFLSGSAVPSRATAAVAAPNLVTTSATVNGQVQTTFSAGRAVLRAATITTGGDTFPVEVIGGGEAGSKRLILRNADGLFAGCSLSGTGIPALSYIDAMEGDGRTIQWSAAFTDKVQGPYTAVRGIGGSIVFPLIGINRPMQIGQIV